MVVLNSGSGQRSFESAASAGSAQQVGSRRGPTTQARAPERKAGSHPAAFKILPAGIYRNPRLECQIHTPEIDRNIRHND